jgi:hypothetical protein
MIKHNNVLDAVNAVLSWDLPDEACPEAIVMQASHMDAMDAEDAYFYPMDRAVH